MLSLRLTMINFKQLLCGSICNTDYTIIQIISTYEFRLEHTSSQKVAQYTVRGQTTATAYNLATNRNQLAFQLKYPITTSFIFVKKIYQFHHHNKLQIILTFSKRFSQSSTVFGSTSIMTLDPILPLQILPPPPLIVPNTNKYLNYISQKWTNLYSMFTRDRYYQTVKSVYSQTLINF